MRLRFILPVALCCLLFPLLSQAQHKGQAELWLTTPDRSNLVALQSAPLKFHAAARQSSAIEVDDTQKLQTIDGFGFAVTGGSAQLMMAMDPAHRTALLQELFGKGKDRIHVSYIRVSIGASDMNDHVYTYDDLPEGSTDAALVHFDLGEDRKYVIPVLKEIVAIDPTIRILGSPWSAPSCGRADRGPADIAAAAAARPRHIARRRAW